MNTADPLDQLELFRMGIALLGGVEATSRLIGIGSSSLRHFRNGTRPLHPGIMEAMSRAAIAHADALRAFERRINPGFTANLTADQLHARRHGNAFRPEVRR